MSVNCPHDITERDIAVSADGYCPLCMAEQMKEMREEISRLTAAAKVRDPLDEIQERYAKSAERAIAAAEVGEQDDRPDIEAILKARGNIERATIERCAQVADKMALSLWVCGEYSNR